MASAMETIIRVIEDKYHTALFIKKFWALKNPIIYSFLNSSLDKYLDSMSLESASLRTIVTKTNWSTLNRDYFVVYWWFQHEFWNRNACIWFQTKIFQIHGKSRLSISSKWKSIPSKDVVNSIWIGRTRGAT